MRRILIAFFLFALPAFAQSPDHQFEAGGLMTYTFLEKIGTRDAGVGTESVGIGGRLVYKPVRFLDLETEINFLPGNSATSGNHIQGFFGAKVGQRFNKVGVFAKVRPGFMHFRKDPFGASNPGSGLITADNNWATSTEPSLDIGGVFEYYTTRGLILRFDLGDNIIRYVHDPFGFRSSCRTYRPAVSPPTTDKAVSELVSDSDRPHQPKTSRFYF
jgi:hypothetical protein